MNKEREPAFERPSLDAVRDYFSRCNPEVLVKDFRFLSEGWDSWVFEADEVLVRVPKREDVVRLHAKELGLLPVLAKALPWPIPDHEYSCAAGPNGKPFTAYRRIPGVPLTDAPPGESPELGDDIGRFLRALHDFPPDAAAGLGTPAYTPDSWRKYYSEFFEDIVRRIFPLLGCESQSLTVATFDQFLADDANFDFKPAVIHFDFGPEHILVDPETRRLTGVIDFGDVVVGDPAADLTWFLGALADAAGHDAIERLKDAYGQSDAAAFEPRTAFYRSLWPYHTILFGLHTEDEAFVQEGIEGLNKMAYERRVQCR